MNRGLNDSTSVGRCGHFTGKTGKRTMAHNTCVIHGVTLYSHGISARIIGEPFVGPDTRFRVTHESWTGRTIEMTADGSSVTVDLRLTLPGPLFTTRGLQFGFDWAVGSSVVDMESLPDGRCLKAFGIIARPPRILLLKHDHTPCLVVTSRQPRSLEIITNEHWWFTFDRPGGRVMIVPLLKSCDAPRTRASAALWLKLVDSPPVRIEERYTVADDAVTITITGTARLAGGGLAPLCPLPPMAAILGTQVGNGRARRALQIMDRGTTLLHTLTGPYMVLRGSSYQRMIRLDWTRTRMFATRKVTGRLTPLPRELVYAGDMTWDEGSPMDQLMSLRVWAPLCDIVPRHVWQAVKRRVRIPAAKAFRKSIAYYKEPANGRVWAKDKALFEESGEVSYDTDWYNGLSLSGLARSAFCADQSVARDARRLAAAVRGERASFLAYYEIYNDWAMDASWTDTRGELLDYDCAHSGLDGILGEARIREMEGDNAGRDWCLYLAGRFAVNFLASYDMAVWHMDLGTLINPDHDLIENKNDAYGLRFYRERWGAYVQTRQTKFCVTPAPEFPEYCMLLKMYGPGRLMKRLADNWREKCPDRYSDWLAYYVGRDIARKIRSGREDATSYQEAREQAAVFYPVAHETALRLFVLDEDPDKVEAMYKIPMPLSEQVLCRCGARIAMVP
ncbi:MAG: hypothetical protein V1899_07075 [Planctomycetota bacterium]